MAKPTVSAPPAAPKKAPPAPPIIKAAPPKAPPTPPKAPIVASVTVGGKPAAPTAPSPRAPAPDPQIAALTAALADARGENVKMQQLLSAARKGRAPMSAKDVYERKQPPMTDANDWRIAVHDYSAEQALAGTPVLIPGFSMADDEHGTITLDPSKPQLAVYFAVPHDADPPPTGQAKNNPDNGTTYRVNGYLAMHSALDAEGRATRLDEITAAEYNLLTSEPSEEIDVVEEAEEEAAPVDEQPEYRDGPAGKTHYLAATKDAPERYWDNNAKEWRVWTPPAPVAPKRGPGRPPAKRV